MEAQTKISRYSHFFQEKKQNCPEHRYFIDVFRVETRELCSLTIRRTSERERTRDLVYDAVQEFSTDQSFHNDFLICKQIKVVCGKFCGLAF